MIPLKKWYFSLSSTLRRALFWFTKLSVIRQQCLLRCLRMPRTSQVRIFVSFASSSGPNDFVSGTSALLSSSSIWTLLHITTTAQSPACELHLSDQCNFLEGWLSHGGSLLRSMTSTPTIRQSRSRSQLRTPSWSGEWGCLCPPARLQSSGKRRPDEARRPKAHRFARYDCAYFARQLPHLWT